MPVILVILMIFTPLVIAVFLLVMALLPLLIIAMLLLIIAVLICLLLLIIAVILLLLLVIALVMLLLLLIAIALLLIKRRKHQLTVLFSLKNKENTRKQEIFKIIYAIMTIHVPTNLAGTNNKAHTGTDK